MNKSILLVLSILIMFGFQSLLSQVMDKTEEEKPQTQPAIKYDLTPRFHKETSWEESFRIVNKQISTYVDRSGDFKVSFKAKIGKVENNKPIEFTISDLTGKVSITKDYHENGETTTNEVKLQKDEIAFTVDNDYKLSVEFEKIKEMSNFVVFYPAGNLIEFELPKSNVSVGESWNSTTLYPMNLHILKSAGGESKTTLNKSEFKLVKVENIGISEVAQIKWVGNFTASHEDDGDRSVTFSWERYISFDLTNSRLLSATGSLEAVENSGLKLLTMSTERIIKYGDAKKIEEQKVVPKDEDE